MKTIRTGLVLAPAVLLLSLDLHSRGGGYYNSTATRSAPSCGNCHRPSPGAAAGYAAVQTEISPLARVLSAGQATTVSVAVRGGASGSQGGFSCDATAGTFSAGTNSRLQASGAAISNSNASARSWSFGYSAPSTPGLVEMFAVGLAANGDGNEDDLDMWSFSGFDQTASTSTPTRLFVNATGVTPIGSSCVGGYRNTPVFGSRQVPTVGNSAFTLELHGAAPSSPAGMILGINLQQPPIDLGFIGVTGCQLYVDPTIIFNVSTSSGNAQRGEGAVTIPLPIPALTSLRNRSLLFQAFFVDTASGRATPMTFTNGLTVVVQ
jgi:hypothetical protein